MLNRVRAGWSAGADGIVRGPGTLAAAIVDGGHSDHPHHLDIAFVLNVDRWDETAVLDCVTGVGDDERAAVEQALQIWMATTAPTVFELLAQTREHASHFGPDDPQGFPGWHMIGGAIVGWASGEETFEIRDWMAAATPWHELAAIVDPDLDRPALNGIKIYVAGSPDFETAEVRLNGRRHDAASSALQQMAWPRPAALGSARTYCLLVHREEPPAQRTTARRGWRLPGRSRRRP